MTRNYHPDYSEFIEEFVELADVYAGQRRIKQSDKQVQYLKPTSGMISDGYPAIGSIGYDAYQRYIWRANFPETFGTAVRRILGILHRNPPTISLPPELEILLTDADGNGTPLADMLIDINELQLVYGRLGILGDIKITNTRRALPVLKLYDAISIENWATEQDSNKPIFIQLNESSEQLDLNDFQYKNQTRYRVLRILEDLDGNYDMPVYSTAVITDSEQSFNDAIYTIPNVAGNALTSIPFVFVNGGNLKPSISQPPMAGLKNIVLSIYRASADYESSLYQTSSETLVITGRMNGVDPDEPVRIGSGSVINLQQGGEAEFIGPMSRSLAEQRTAIDAKFERASQLASQLAIQSKSSRDTGESLSIRLESATTAYGILADVGAMALENAIKLLAPAFNVPQTKIDKISIIPNKEFASNIIDAETFADLQNAKLSGLKISDKSLHELLRKRGATEFSFEEELEFISQEEDILD